MTDQIPPTNEKLIATNFSSIPPIPRRWDFAMDFIGDPEASEIQSYVNELTRLLEAERRSLREERLHSDKLAKALKHARDRAVVMDPFTASEMDAALASRREHLDKLRERRAKGVE